MSTPSNSEIPVADVLAGIDDDYDPVAIAEKKAQELANPALFKFMSFLQDGGRSLPTEELTVFTGLGAQLEIQRYQMRKLQLLDEAKEAAGTLFASDMEAWSHAMLGTITDSEPPNSADEQYKIDSHLPAEFYTLDEKIAAQQAALFDSRIVFTIKGIAPRVVQVIDSNMAKYKSKLVEDKVAPDLLNELYMMRRITLLTLAAVQRLEVPAQGIVLTDRLKPQEVYEILYGIERDEREKIMDMVMVLTFAVAIADPRTDAGFLSRRAQSAGAEGVPDNGESGGELGSTSELPTS